MNDTVSRLQLPRLYLAAPLFSEAERGFNARLASLLERRFEVFLPQRDGRLLIELTSEGMSPNAAARFVFDADLLALRDADVVLAVLDGRTIDEGVAFEIGVAYERSIPCFGLQTDPRRLLPTGNNPMIDPALARVLNGLHEIEQWANSWVRDVDGTTEDAAVPML